MESNGFRQHILSPTHVEGGILDLVFMPFDSTISDLKVLDAQSISDHYPIEFKMNVNTPKLPKLFQSNYRDLSKIHIEKFKGNILQIF